MWEVNRAPALARDMGDVLLSLIRRLAGFRTSSWGQYKHATITLTCKAIDLLDFVSQPAMNRISQQNNIFL